MIFLEEPVSDVTKERSLGAMKSVAEGIRCSSSLGQSNSFVGYFSNDFGERYHNDLFNLCAQRPTLIAGFLDSDTALQGEGGCMCKKAEKNKEENLKCGCTMSPMSTKREISPQYNRTSDCTRCPIVYRMSIQH